MQRAGSGCVPSLTCECRERYSPGSVLLCTDAASHFQMSPAVGNSSLLVYLCFYYLLKLSVGHNSKLSFCGLLESMGFYSSAQQGIRKCKKCSLCLLWCK